MLICQKCNQEKLENDFTNLKKWCKICVKEYNKTYREKNKDKYKKYKQTDEYKEKSKLYKQKIKKHIQEWSKQYYKSNKDRIQKYYTKNKDKIMLRNKAWERERIKNDICFKIKKNVSAYIRNFIKKNYKTAKSYLPYTMLELKIHLEKQFQPWMTWENYGTYKINWNDNNPYTWTWQIDHIIPHSELPYTSMEDENFKKCWALENLRPLSSKQNLLDGVRRTRHKKN